MCMNNWYFSYSNATVAIGQHALDLLKPVSKALSMDDTRTVKIIYTIWLKSFGKSD